MRCWRYIIGSWSTWSGGPETPRPGGRCRLIGRRDDAICGTVEHSGLGAERDVLELILVVGGNENNK